MKMEFVIVMHRSAFLTGIIYRWSILTILAVICIPYLASQETGIIVKNSWVKIIPESRNVTSGNVNITTTNPEVGTSNVVKVNNSLAYPGNESRYVTEAIVHKASDNLEGSLRSEAIFVVNNSSTNLKEGTSHVTGIQVNDSQISPGGYSHRVTEINVNKDVEESSRSVTIVNFNITSTNFKEETSGVNEVKVNNSRINVNEDSSHETKINVTKNSNNSFESISHAAEFNDSTILNPRSRRVMEGAVNNSRSKYNLQSRRVTAATVNASMSGPNEHSRNVTFWESGDEGSAHGSLLDILGMSDDEDDEDNDGTDDSDDDGTGETGRRDDGLQDDGGGGVDEAGSAMVPDVNSSTLVTCFRCHGDGLNGCDVSIMVGNVQAYSVMCSGKCLNVSSGATAVYDCANDMQTHTDTCLQSHDTRMCFCTGSFCNGPASPREFNISTSALYPNIQLPPDVEVDHNSSDGLVSVNNILKQKSTYELSRINQSKTGYENMQGSIDMKKEEPSFDIRSQIMDSKNDTSSYLQDLFADNNTHISRDTRPQIQPSLTDKINFIITENNSDRLNSSVTLEELSPNAIDISDLRVGKLKDNVADAVSKNCQEAVNVNNIVLSVMISSLLTLMHVL